ncbi:retrotransposon protein, putative, ty1-copia subclass [Tanacetum coccineum]
MTTSIVTNLVFKGFFEKQKITGPNFIDWYRQLRIVLSVEDKLDYLEQPIPHAPVLAQAGQQVAPEALAAHTAWVKGSKEIVGLMLMTMEPDIQRNLENLSSYDMLQELKTLFAQQANQELLQTVRDFHSCKQEDGKTVSSYVLKMKSYIDNLERLGHPVSLNLGVSLILISLRKEFDSFMQNYNMHSMGKTVNELHAMLKLHEQTLTKKDYALHAIRAGKCAAVEAIGTYHLCLPSGLVIVLNNFHYAPSITRGIISVSRFVVPRDGIFEIDLSNSNAIDSSIPFKTVSRQRASYFVTFTDDFSHYGYVYLLKHKHKVFETFKLFQKEVENHIEKTIKSLRSDHGGEYMSQEFLDHLKEHSIITHRTPPYTPQHNCMSERRNRTLLDMVRSMMSQTTLPKSFWDYVLETAARILNMVPTKKVEKTPYEVWHGQAPKLSNLKVWGCEALVKQDTLTKTDKLEPRSIKCIFVGYPKETMGYSFYYPPENKVLVARNAKFIKNSLITQEASGSLEDLKIIQEEDTHPSIDTSLNHEDDDLEIDEPQSDIIPIRRSTRTRNAPNRMCLYIDAKEYELGDLGEPANYKAALLDSESDKWLNAMNVEMQSMKDNEVWDLVDLPSNSKTVGSKWLFKKKTDMDGAAHTFKAHIELLGFFYPTAYYDYEIWQMDVKTAFLNGHLSEEVYMEQLEASGSNVTFLILYVDDILIMGNNIPMLQDVKSYLGRCFAMKDLGEAAYILGIKIYRDRSRRLIGLCQSAYIEKILKRFHMENSKRGSIPMQEKLRLSKSQGASTPAELKRMQNVPYASAVGSIMYAVRCTRPDVAFAQNITSRFQQNPGDLHWTTVKNILKYLRNTKDMFLVYGGDIKRELRVSCYTDAGYLTDADDLKSQTGYVFVLNGGAVDWKSTKQSIFATSSAEAEYIAAYDASKEAVWVRKFIFGLGVVPTIEEPINMYCDNTGAITIANESGITKGARHFRAKVHYLREVIEYGDIKLEKVHTDDNLADPFTKALAFPKHSEHTRNIGMLPASSLM